MAPEEVVWLRANRRWKCLDCVPNQEPINLDHMKVLLVDDDPVTRALYGRLLRNWGCDIVEAEDGLVALEILGRQEISVLARSAIG